MTRNKLILSIVLIAVITILIVAVSLAWFSAAGAQHVGTNGIVISAADSANLTIDFSGTPVEDNRYFGQKGTQATGLDAPYVVEYTPVGLDAHLSESGYMCVNINKVDVVLAGFNEDGTQRIEEYTAVTKPDDKDYNLFEYFTIRIYMLSIVSPSGEVQDYSEEPLIYLPENGYLVSADYTTETVDGREVPVYQTFTMQDGYQYTFGMQIIFQSEQNYRELQYSHADLDEEDATPLSDPSYMYSKIVFNMRFESNPMHVITYDGNGGKIRDGGNLVNTTTQKVFGWEYLDLPQADRSNSTAQEVGYRFDGWFFDPECTEPVDPACYVDEHLKGDVTLYAGWTQYPAVTYYGMDDSTVISTHYVPFDTADTAPSYSQNGYALVGWSTDPNATWEDEDLLFDTSTVITQDVSLYAVMRRAYTITLNLAPATPNIRYVDIAFHDGDNVTNKSGRGGSTFSFTVYEGETWGDYLNTASSRYLEVTDVSGSYKFYGWTTDYSGMTARNLFPSSVKVLENTYAFDKDLTLYAQTYLT